MLMISVEAPSSGLWMCGLVTVTIQIYTLQPEEYFQKQFLEKIILYFDFKEPIDI